MSTAGLINRYVWFVTTIYNRGPITLEEMQCRFESHFGRGEELGERNDEYSIFEYRLCPSFDFRQKLMSMGVSVGVLAPVTLKDILRKKAETTAINNASAGMGSQYKFKVYKK